MDRKVDENDQDETSLTSSTTTTTTSFRTGGGGGYSESAATTTQQQQQPPPPPPQEEEEEESILTEPIMMTPAGEGSCETQKKTDDSTITVTTKEQEESSSSSSTIISTERENDEAEDEEEDEGTLSASADNAVPVISTVSTAPSTDTSAPPPPPPAAAAAASIKSSSIPSASSASVSSSPSSSSSSTGLLRKKNKDGEEEAEEEAEPMDSNDDNDNNVDDDDDVIAKAAVTYAALAAAATANHRSPAEAARSARLAAQTLLLQQQQQQNPEHHQQHHDEQPQAENSSTTAAAAAAAKLSSAATVSSKPRQLTRLDMAAVLRVLQQHCVRPNGGGSGRSVLQRLVAENHTNPGFLSHLFLLEYYILDDTTTATTTSEDDVLAAVSSSSYAAMKQLQQQQQKLVSDEQQVQQACAHVLTLLKTLEGAYDSLIAMLPPTTTASSSSVAKQQQQQQQYFMETAAATTATTSDSLVLLDDNNENDYETPVVVPDLLPPCTSARGDATLAFFRACVGSTTEPDSAPLPPPQARTTSASATHPPPQQHHSTTDASLSVSSNDAAPPSPTRQRNHHHHHHHHNSSFLGMFKRPHASPSSTQNAAIASVAGGGSGGSSSSGVGSGLGSVFRKKSFRMSKSLGGDDGAATTNTNTTTSSSTAERGSSGSNNAMLFPPPGCYSVKIEREMLGLTVENVLERTVVRTVLPGGPAKKAGAQVGSLIVQVGNTPTRNLTHFETIDELRQSQRPLLLVLKHVGEDTLRLAREEMGRLIRGAGFGLEEQQERPLQQQQRDLRLDSYTNLIRRRWEGDKLGEKLVWILTFFVLGLEREADRLHRAFHDDASVTASPRRRHSVYSHTAQEYADAAKSVGKVLWDYTRKKLLPSRKPLPPPPPPPPPPTSSRRSVIHAPVTMASTTIHEKPLLQIGDVLQRTRTFLADTTSPPAALLRGELISFLCDVLDSDTEMELAEEESVSSSVGSNVVGSGAGASVGTAVINDLGSAGSLLKLIVLNAPIMRSPGCRDDAVEVDEEELRRRFGPRESFTGEDMHKLHAGNRFLSVVHRLAASRSTSARITACSLGPVLWGHLDFPHQLQLRGVITRALHDVEVFVRKSTATVLHEIAELVFDRRCVPWLVLMCERAMTDPEPQLRSAAMTLTWHLAEHLPNAFLGNASQGSRYLRRLPSRDDPIFADVYLLQCKLLPVATRLAEDRSPSVRLAVAAQCDRLCDALGDHWSSVIIDVLLALLSDADERVRCEAVACVPRLAEIVLLSVAPGETAMSEVSVLEALMPASIKLQSDSSSSVRIALAAAAGELLGLLVEMQARVAERFAVVDPTSHSHYHNHTVDPEEVAKKYKRQVDDRLIPLLQSLLNDKDPEVTSAALRAVTNATRRSFQPPRHRRMSTASIEDDSASLSSFHSHASDNKNAPPVLTPVLSEAQVLRLLPTLSELADSKQWRVRQSAVEIVPALLGCTQKMETRKEISKLCVRLMSDEVDAVRKTAAECLCMGGSSLGSHGEDASAEWVASIVIPAIRTCALHSDSKQRLLSLKMVQTMLMNGACPTKWKGEDSERMADTPMRELASISLSLTSDRIANVRLNVGRSLEPVLHVFDEDDVSFIREVLMQQMDNERESGIGDRDVLYFADKCVQKAKSILEDRSVGDDTRLSC